MKVSHGSPFILEVNGYVTGPTSVNDVSLPSVFSLSQNFPNPFNPATNFEFRITESGFVTLKVYNLLGDEVATIVNKRLKAGNYRYKWKPVNLASGVYLYQLREGNFKETKKLILLK